MRVGWNGQVRGLRVLRSGALRGGESGFTLTELIITVVMLGVVVGPLAMAIISALTTTDKASRRFALSHDAQIMSAYLANDVQSAKVITNGVCGSLAGYTPLVSFSYDGASQIASYLYENAGDERKLLRQACDAGGTVTSVATLAHLVSSTQTPSVQCDGAACDPVVQPRPRQVTIDIVEGSSEYQFAVGGARRVTGQQVVDPPPGSAPRLLVLGPGGLDVGGQGSLTVQFGSAYSNAGLRMNGANAALNASSLYVIGGCTGNPGNCASTGYQTYTVPLPDPLLGLLAPAMPPASTGCAQVAGPNWTCASGTYNAKLTLEANRTYTLQAGTYYLNNGLGVQSSNVNVVSDGEVFFYVAAGSVNFTGGTASLAAPLSGTYKDVLVFQARSNTSTMNIAGGAGVSSYNGLIYAPAASQVTLSAGGGSLGVCSVIAPSVVVTGNGDVTIGSATCPTTS